MPKKKREVVPPSSDTTATKPPQDKEASSDDEGYVVITEESAIKKTAAAANGDAVKSETDLIQGGAAGAAGDDEVLLGTDALHGAAKSKEKDGLRDQEKERGRSQKRQDGDRIRDAKDKLGVDKQKDKDGSKAGSISPSHPLDGSQAEEGGTNEYFTRSKANKTTSNSETAAQYKTVKDVHINFEQPKEDILDYVTVTFHAVVGSADNQQILYGKKTPYILFGNPLSNWEECLVELQLQNTSHYAYANSFGYLTGDLRLPKNLLGTDIPYKYVLRTSSNNFVWELLKSDSGLSELDRLLFTDTKSGRYHKYDEDLIFSCNSPKISKQDVILVFMDTINPGFIQKEGISAALVTKEAIFNAHKEKRKYYFLGGTNIYTKYNSFNVSELERRVFSNILKDYNAQVEREELPKQMFLLVAYLLLFVESSSVSIDSLKVIKSVFKTLTRIWPRVMQKRQIEEYLPALSLQIKLKKALVKTANSQFLIMDRPHLHLTKEDLEGCSSWIIILPYIKAVDNEIDSVTKLLQGVDKEKWIRLANKHSLRLLKHSSEVQSCSLVKEATLSAVSSKEIMDLFSDASASWTQNIPFNAVAIKFFKVLFESDFDKEAFGNASSQLLTRLQLHLVDERTESHDLFTIGHILSIFDTVKSKSYRLLWFTNVLLQMIQALFEAEVATPEEIEFSASTLVNEACQRLQSLPVKDHWLRWVKFYHRADPLGQSEMVVDLFRKKINSCSLDECLDVYSVWTDDDCQELLDIVLGRAVESLVAVSAANTGEGYFSINFIKSVFTGNSAKKKTVSLLSNFVLKTFKNGVDRDRIVKMCHGAELKIFGVMVEFQKDFAGDIKDHFKRVAIEVSALTEDLRHGRCSVLQFQKFAGKGNGGVAWENLWALQKSLKELTKIEFYTISTNMVNDYQKRVHDFSHASEILEKILPTIQEDHAHLLDIIPVIPKPSEVKLSHLQHGFADLLQISSEELQILSWFDKLHEKSIIFPKLWMDAMSQCSEDSSDKEAVVGNAGGFPDWQSYKNSLVTAKGRIEELLAQLKDKTIAIVLLEKLLSSLEDKDVRKELNALGAPALVDQAQFLRRFRTLEAAVDSFEGMLKVLKRDNFMAVETIKAGFGDNSFEGKMVKDLSEATIRQGQLFETFNEKDVLLLKHFSKCGGIVHWLREHVTSNQELKVFMELASISAGESDIDLDRLMLFQTSINGFAPLLFDIDETSGLEEVMNAVQAVFRNREANPRLGQNIAEINRLLPWIKDIQERHGSVEANSLTTVEHINKSGMFTIRCKDNRGSRWTHPLEAISMSLELAEEQREMEHHELDELRSKLMLVTVKEEGEVNVERYTQMLDSVELIAKKLSNLLDAGCHLFSELKLDGSLDVKKKVKLRVDFGHKSPVYKGKQKLEEALEQVIGFLQKVSDDWHRYIDDLRETHSSLNYFTAEQLVQLSAAFAELVHSRQRSAELSLEAAMLVRSACPELKLEDVKNHVVTAFNRAQGNIIQDDDDMDLSNGGADANEDGIDFSTHPRFRQLVNATGAAENVVLACVANFHGREKATSVDDMQDWCFDHEDDDDEDLEVIIEGVVRKVELQKSREAEAAQAAAPPVVGTRVRHQPEEGKNYLEQCLIQKWSSFQDQNSNDLDAKDYISFQTLALCLVELVREFQSKPDRTFPQYLTQGRPNLLLCPRKDIHKTALMLFQADEKKPSPTLPEVLICTKATTKEQVELICRRAFKDETGKIFVVLHAHLLSFDISIHTENLFSRQTSPNYKIVFISSAEGSEQSYIITAFESSLVTAPPPPQDSVLEAFLKGYQENKAAHIDKMNHPDPNGFSVRLVTSEEYGNGKTLLIQEVSAKAERKIHLSLDEDQVEFADVIACWSKDWQWGRRKSCSIFHLDATLTSDTSRNDLLFSLSVLGGLADATGKLWVCSDTDLVMTELTSPKSKAKEHRPFYKLLPSISCKNPRDVLDIMEAPGGRNIGLNVVDIGGEWVQLMNEKVFLSDVIQRPYQYLSTDPARMDGFSFKKAVPIDQTLKCLKHLLNACPVKTPSWTELLHFSSFLNVQLESTEKSVFCNAAVMGESLQGFKTFVVQFLIQMAQDFATRSVRISDESHGEGLMMPEIEERRQWEQSPHPYIFFNSDDTLSFFGFCIDKHLNLVDEKTREIIKPKFISGNLYHELRQNGVVFNQEFVTQSREEKLARLCTVIGVPVTDPDPSYELTYDNVMKMLAIFMRFRSNIPVVVMGETGSGKTTLVNFMCSLQRGGNKVKNMIIMKIHGGVTKKNIHTQVRKAMEIAADNVQRLIYQTVLFFDEANTTTAINTIKTVMCDRLVDGVPIPDTLGLQFVAAVNPYRKHSEDMIKKLESAGLGYHIQADQTTDKLGCVPMRRLVYRVREIPQSMFPLVWDFGTLDSYTERLYIRQMVDKWLPKNGFTTKVHLNVIESVLSFCQEYMRKQNDECSFVSLRDVDRTLKVLSWFHAKRQDILDDLLITRATQKQMTNVPDVIQNLMLAIGVTYYVRLQDRMLFARNIEASLLKLNVIVPAKLFSELVEKCQDLFLGELRLENNIAPNTALKENVWMMTLCIELRIPLFLVGKPGSSKSLAKTVVSDVMQGEQSYSPFFKNLKEIHMISFQCSPIATAGGILGTFKQSQKFQKDRDLSKFSAVVVLDEVGLAEDSEKMPLKALHPLLEDGCIDEEPEPHMKVSFIGISNWALDPAKMNRGMFVSRGVPREEDLKLSAEGICRNDAQAYKLMRPAINKLTKGYFSLYQKQEREYFGLRDFYSLIKRVFNVAKSGHTPSEDDLIAAIQRNFGGFFGNFDPVDYFLEVIQIAASPEQRIHPETLIYEAIRGTGTEESRYILLLTKNNAALQILQEKEQLMNQRTTHVMFGSSFPQDKEYTNICYNINKVKIAMELGHTVILCNLNNLYESLYDALNQNYVMLGGKRYVDLGLGTHRVKCRVHEDFRLILVAEDEEVHKKFPIPLINRLEKHYLGMETILKPEMQQFVKKLQAWVESFCHLRPQRMKQQQRVDFVPGDVFIGYHSDIIASIVLRLQEEGVVNEEELTERVSNFLLSCAAPDAIMRLSETCLLPEEQLCISKTYYLDQHHSSLASFLKNCPSDHRLLQVTTSSRLLTSAGRLELEEHLELDPGSSTLLTLQQFESRLIFEKHLKDSMTHEKQLLLIQSDVSSEESIKLIECARFVAQDMMKKHGEGKDFRVVFVIHVQRVTGGIFSGMSVHPWLSFHIDELRGQRQHAINIEKLSQEENMVTALEKELVPLADLVIDTVPKAASCVQTEPGRVQRRMDILLQVFKSGQTDLLQIVCAAVRKQLESSKLGDLRKWLLDIAMDSGHLKEGNTYQRSVWLHLQEQIVAPLRACIEALDLDHCLELLLDKNQWLVNGAVQFFNCLPHGTGRDASNIVGSFPFTRVILEELDKLYKAANASGKQLQIALQASNLAQPLLYCFRRRDPAVQRFLLDVAELNFDMNQSSDNARNILCEEILIAAQYVLKERLKESDLEEENIADEEEGTEIQQWEFLSPADIFFAMMTLKPRLVFLHNLLKLDAALCDAATQINENQRRTSTFRTEVILFQKLIAMNPPKANKLHSGVDIQRWCQQVARIGSLFQTLRSLDTKDELLPELQTSFDQYNIVKLFLHHTTKSDFRPTEATLNRLVRLLNNNTLKKKNEFEKFVKILQFANKESIKAHFVGGENDGCVLCEEDFDRPGIEPVELPCGKKHMGCKSCLEKHFHSKEGSEWTCPVLKCGDEIEKTFDFESTYKCKQKVQSHQQFKKDLQFFFLDVLQRYVFANKPPQSEVTKQLMSYVVTTKLERARTKAISPFDNHGIDAALVIRSFLLQLLLQGENFESAIRALSDFLDQRTELHLDIHQFQELCLLSVYCLEDRLLLDQTLATSGRQTTLSMDCCLQLLQKQEKEGVIDQGGELQLLLNVARMRLCILAVAPALNELVADAQTLDRDKADILLGKAVKVICHHNEETQEHMKGFLVRILVRFFSRGLVKEWQQSGEFLELMPQPLSEATFTNSSDNFYISSDNYGNVRAQARAALMGNYNGLKEMLAGRADIRTEWNLALYFLGRIEGLRAANVEEFLEKVNKLDPLMATEAGKVLRKDDPLWTAFEPCNETQVSLLCFLHYLKTTLVKLRNGNYLQDGLQNITDQRFFPTMEQDDSVEIMNELLAMGGDERGKGQMGVTAVYRCPNCRTPFGIADCGKPITADDGIGKCPQCSTLLGGDKYDKFLGSGQSSKESRAVLQDETKTGHILGPIEGYAKAKPERQLGEMEVAVTQFMLHASMAIKFPHDGERLLRCIDPQPESIPDFLMRHLLNNLEQICQALGKSNDDVMVLLYHVARRLTTLSPRMVNPRAGLGDKKRRLIWETDFVHHVIAPEMKALTQSVAALTARMVGERTAADEVLETLLTSKDDEKNDVKDRILIAPFWFPRDQLNMSSLEQAVGKDTLRKESPNLFRLLKGKEILCQVKQVPNLLRLQFTLGKKFFKKIESPLVDDIAVERFLAEAHLGDSERTALESLVENYFAVFNSIKQEVFNNGQMGNAAKEFLKGRDLSLKSSAGILFASEHPAGQCAKALLDLLVSQHNRLLDTYASNVDGGPLLPEPLQCSEDISANQLVTFEEKELNLMLVMHSEYTLEVGGQKETKWKLNESDLERSIIERFFVGRAKFRIDSLPNFLFRNDDIVMEPLREKIPQEPLNLKLRGQMIKELDELRDVGSVIDHLQTTLAILQRTECNSPDESLYTKMEQLHLLPEHGSRALRGLKLAHAEACLAFLTLLRARWMLRNKHDPYNLIQSEYHHQLPDDACRSLKPLVDHTHLDQILFQLHQFIHARLKKTATAVREEVGMDPASGLLKDYFGAFLDSIDEEESYERASLFGDKLQNGQTIAVFVELLEKYMPM